MKNPPASKRPTNSKWSLQYFTPVNVQSLLNWTRQLEPELLAYFAIGAFAGARRGEVLLLDWKDIDLVGRGIHVKAVRASMSPTPRYLRISDNLAAWLSLCIKSAGPILDPKVAKSIKRRRLAVCSHAGLSVWPPHALRHSFGTYHLALHKDVTSTMQEMGHSTRHMLEKHYYALVTPTAAKAYFGIYPLGHPLATAPLTLVSQAPAKGRRKPVELVP